jgi:phosphate transport system substrate-binding protein
VPRAIMGFFVLSVISTVLTTADALSGFITIAGNGPEFRTLERLTRAFEQDHLGSVVEIRWDSSFNPVQMVKTGEADFAVTGQTDADLVAIPIAWDGIAILVDFTNPIKEVTLQQVADMFSGKVTRWSSLGGPDLMIQLIDPENQPIRGAFEKQLGIVEHIPVAARMRRSDQRAISTVAGNMAAVTYASLGSALEAVTYGVGVNLLLVDHVEAAKETVKSGRYALRRPVLLLRKKDAHPVADAFAAFVLSDSGQDIVEDMFVRYRPPKGTDYGQIQ